MAELRELVLGEGEVVVESEYDPFGRRGLSSGQTALTILFILGTVGVVGVPLGVLQLNLCAGTGVALGLLLLTALVEIYVQGALGNRMYLHIPGSESRVGLGDLILNRLGRTVHSVYIYSNVLQKIGMAALCVIGAMALATGAVDMDPSSEKWTEYYPTKYSLLIVCIFLSLIHLILGLFIPDIPLSRWLGILSGAIVIFTGGIIGWYLYDNRFHSITNIQYSDNSM